MNQDERKRHYIEQARQVGGLGHAEAMRITLDMMLENPQVIAPVDVWAWARKKLKEIAEEKIG